MPMRFVLFASVVLSCTSSAFTKYHPKNLLDANDGFLHRQGIFDAKEVKEILTPHLNDLMRQLQPETQNSAAHHRQGISLAEDHALHKFFAQDSNRLTSMVRNVTRNPFLVIAKEVPIDVRRYSLKSSMDWHVDDVLYSPAQIEVIWCFRNTSNCETLYRRGDSNQIHGVRTEDNSAILIQAGGPMHAVTTVTRGERVIVKLAYVDASKSRFAPDSTTKEQFPSTTFKQKRNKSGRR